MKGKDILSANFESVKNHPYFKNYEVTLNRNKTIVIKVSNTVFENTNYFSSKKQKSLGQQYRIGFNPYYGATGKFWIRHINGAFMYPLHYNKETGNYGFDTFEEAIQYFLNYWEIFGAKRYKVPYLVKNINGLPFVMEYNY